MAAWDDLGVTADPGRVHTEGRMVRAALEQAREQVAALFTVRPRQVVLTSGGTESVNSAVWGVVARHGPGPSGGRGRAPDGSHRWSSGVRATLKLYPPDRLRSRPKPQHVVVARGD